MKTVLLIAAVAVAGTVFAGQDVDHAPTAAQCQADRAYWMSKLEDTDTSTMENISYETLDAWSAEMYKCRVVDPPNSHKYDFAEMEVIAFQHVRLIDFLNRHKLLPQFKSEDAAGAR
jgi:hypothetical protein